MFLSTDAGGTGLNLQAADCVINFELPWNPAKMNQRIGRVSRIGQQSGCVNVINLVAKHSIEERILTGIQIKTDLFKGVFDDGPDAVEFSREKRNELLNRLREMMGEETMDLPGTPLETEGIPEDTPHFLNPGVLNRETDDRVAEAARQTESDAESFMAGQSPERIETVLNSGMAFISGLMEMATGRKVQASAADEKMVRINRETGEVTMSFKLPGWG